MPARLLPRRVMADRRGDEPKSTTYHCIDQGTLTPPVKKGSSSFWPEDEIEAINKAIIKGATDDEIRALVQELLAARASAQGGAA